MGLKVRLLFIFSVLVLALAYYTMPAYPATANKPVLKSLLGLIFQCIFLFAAVGHYLGVGSWVNITRTVIQTIALLDDGGNGDILQSASTIEGVKVLVFRPKAEVATRRPGIVYYHGGGWTIMSPESYAAVTREIAEQTQSVVISVDYRLSPEHLFPAAFDDCLKVTKFFLKNAETFDVDPNKVAVMGDSAGGNLAMAVALALTKEKDLSLPKLRLQSLVYPALQAFDFYLPAYVKHADGPGLLRKRNMIGWWLSYAFGNFSLYNEFASNCHVSDDLRRSKYATYVNVDVLPKDIQGNLNGRQTYIKGNKTLSDIIEHIILDPRFAPLMSSDDDLALLPPTYILITEFDVLRDDGFLAASRLQNAGVPVTQVYLPGEDHGFLNHLAIDNNAKEEIKRFALFFNKTVT